MCSSDLMQGAGNAAGDVALQLIVGHAFAGNELGSAIGELNDNGRVDLGGGFQHGIDRVGTDGVDCREGKLVVFGVFIQRF